MFRLMIKRTGIEQFGGQIAPNITAKLEKNKIASRFCRAIYSGPGLYEIDMGRITHVVKLECRTCTCGAFQLTGIPCPHAIAAIQSAKRDKLSHM